MTDLTTDAGIAAVRARLLGESDRLTDADLDAIERRSDELVDSMDGREPRWQMDLANDLITLLAEVRRLRAAERRVREVARELRYGHGPDTYDTVGRFLAALDGEQ